MASGYPYAKQCNSSKKMILPSSVVIHNPLLSVNNPLVVTQSTTTSTTTTTEVQEEISTEKEEETDVQWTLKAATDNELLKEDKEYHANQNYIDQDGKEQHYSVLMAKLYQTNNIKPIKKKGIKRKVSEFVSSCKERLSILQTKKTIQKRTLK